MGSDLSLQEQVMASPLGARLEALIEDAKQRMHGRTNFECHQIAAGLAQHLADACRDIGRTDMTVGFTTMGERFAGAPLVGWRYIFASTLTPTQLVMDVIAGGRLVEPQALEP